MKSKPPSNRILLYPNTPNNVRLKANYEFLSVGVQFSPDYLPGNGDEETKGGTDTFQIETVLISSRWYGDLSYKKVRGFYLENTSDFTTRMPGDPYIQFPDLYHRGLSFSAGFIENPKYSFRSLTSQTERQLRSAGSLIPVFNFDYYIIDDQSNAAGTQKSKNIEISLGPGYSHTFVIKEKLYLSLGLTSSLGYMNTRLATRNSEGNLLTNQDNFIFRCDGRTGLGYNGSRFYTGVYTSMSGTRYKQENTSVLNTETRLFYHLFFGVRFKAPGVLERFVDKVGKGLS